MTTIVLCWCKGIHIMKLFIIFLSILFLLLFSASEGKVYAADVISPSDHHTASEEIEGKAMWEKLQAKQTTCDKLSDDDFERLGEYFMGQMVGSSHEAMNKMTVQMMGEKGEEQMHIVIGKRSSGCDASAAFPEKGTGFMPMMNMMMGSWGSFGLGWLSMLLFLILLIVGIIALIRYLAKSGDNKEGKTPLDILKERYARGEIDKKEFGDKRKDLI